MSGSIILAFILGSLLMLVLFFIRMEKFSLDIYMVLVFLEHLAYTV